MVWILVLFLIPFFYFSSGQEHKFNSTTNGSDPQYSRIGSDNDTINVDNGTFDARDEKKLTFYGGSVNATEKDSEQFNDKKGDDLPTPHFFMAGPNRSEDTHGPEPKPDSEGWLPAWVGYRSKADDKNRVSGQIFVPIVCLLVIRLMTN